MNARTLAARFREGDREWHRKQVAQFFVIKTVLDDPLRAVEVYRILSQDSGDHAAEVFYRLLQQAKERSIIFLWYHLVAMTQAGSSVTAVKLFLDDVRDSPAGEWTVVRSVAAAIAHVEKHGMPEFISFDHDLGMDVPTGQDFAKWLVNRHLDGIPLPASFSYAVHSANPPGAANIRGLLDGFLRSIR